jgi:hypothetical chaperone protein
MQKYLYGIDFGTSNSSLTIYDRENKVLLDTFSVPSVLYFPTSQMAGKSVEYYVGQEAIDAYITDGMKGRFMKSIKQVLAVSSFESTRIGDQLYSASDLVAFILKALKEKADAYIGYSCKTTIVGRPVFFNDADTVKDQLAQKQLEEAAKKAGFEVVQFQLEPISAAFAYEKTISKKEMVLVVDLGGGTTDFTFMALDPNKATGTNRKMDILATGGVYIGGDSFDASFMWEQGTPHFGRGVQYESMPGKWVDLPTSFFQYICSWTEMNFFNGSKVRNSMQQYYIYTRRNRRFKNLITLVEKNLGFSLFQEIERTKCDLSCKENAVFTYHQAEIDIEDPISVEHYSAIIEDDVLRIRQYLDRFISDNNIEISTVDSLFLTGGTALVVAVQHLFHEIFSGIPIQTGDHFMSVSKGLALSEYLLEGR